MTPTLDSIIESLPHSLGCSSQRIPEGADWFEYAEDPSRFTPNPCNCPRREQVAYLERLKEPTERMKRAGYDARCWMEDDSGWSDEAAQNSEATLEAMLKAAEESQDE